MSAWAILLSTYTGSSIARFGVISGASEGCCKVLLEEWSASLEPAKCVEKTVSLAKERCELNPREDRHRGRFNSCIVLGSQVTWLKRWIEEVRKI